MSSSEIAAESPEPDEDFYAEKIADRFIQALKKRDEGTLTQRMFHPKMHGLLKAEFVVQPDLPENLKKGLFAQEKTYPAWVRLSNAKRFPSADRKKDMRGMAIKLMDVPGEKLLEGEKDAVTHDFLLVTAPALQTKSVKDFQKSIEALLDGGLKLFFFAITHIGVIRRSLRQISKCANLLEMQYFSMTPYLFGDRQAVKYSTKPRKAPTSSIPRKPGDNDLRERLVADVGSADHYFDFMVQLQEDAKKMPIEDPTVEWTSKMIKVATLKIPRQSFDSGDQRKYGENLSFTPWHAIAAHRPLGGANRARKLVYERIAAFRRGKNNVADTAEPTALKDFE